MEEPYYQEQFGFVEDESVKSSDTTDSEIDNYLSNLDNRPEELDISSEKLVSGDSDSDSEDRPPKEKPFPKIVISPIKKNKPQKVTKPKRKDLEYQPRERKQKAKSCCRSIKKKEYSVSKTKKIIAGLVWLEIILIILIWIISFVWAYVLTGVGIVINEAISDVGGDLTLSHVFGIFCWIAVYCLGLGVNIYYRSESISFSNGSVLATEILKYVGHSSLHITYFLIRFPILFSMIYYSVENDMVINENMVILSLWFDTIVAGLSAVVIFLVWGTIKTCC